jgi:transcriptional regulator with XRE-family HTH domain
MNGQKMGVTSRGLGAELTRLRKAAGLTLEYVGARLGTSVSTVSRLENGKREPTTAEVSAILALSGVVGPDRERLLDMAVGRSGGSGMVEYNRLASQRLMFHVFERQAAAITSFQPLLIPGLAQTAKYTAAVISAIRVNEGDDVEVWVRRRMARQRILARRNPPRLNLILTEAVLRAPIGGAEAMADQVRHLAELAQRESVTVRVIPASTVLHAGLGGSFVILDFAKDPSLVYMEGRTTSLYRDDPEEVAFYRLTVERLTDVALDEHGSIELMRSIAHDLDGG